METNTEIKNVNSERIHLPYKLIKPIKVNYA